MGSYQDQQPKIITAYAIGRQAEFSRETFGPGARTAGVLDHIRKELAEIAQDPHDLSEWIDVVILAIDGAWCHGFEPQEIIDAYHAKVAKNMAREWPDWREVDEDKAIEHVKPSTQVYKHSAWHVQCRYCGADYVFSEDMQQFLSTERCAWCGSAAVNAKLRIWVPE